LLTDLLRSQDTRIGVPFVPPPFTDLGTMVTVDVGRGKPGRAATFVHIDTVMIVSEFEWIIVLLCIRSHSRSVLFHRLAKAGMRHIDALEEARIQSRPAAIVRIDHNGLFRVFIFSFYCLLECPGRRLPGNDGWRAGTAT